MSVGDIYVDATALRAEVKAKYREVAIDPSRKFHFHTGRDLARHLGYDDAVVEIVPPRALESFAGVGNPFATGTAAPGDHVVDVGCGAGFDTFIAARQVGDDGAVIGVDMTPEMLERARQAVIDTGLGTVEIREGLAESLPVPDGWADVVISNGVINLCADKRAAFNEVFRVLRSGGIFRFADIANGRPVPEEALRDIDLWTG
jgi:arsenite methyltransferase